MPAASRATAAKNTTARRRASISGRSSMTPIRAKIAMPPGRSGPTPRKAKCATLRLQPRPTAPAAAAAKAAMVALP
jgi:hypothetical protein